jgi:glycosyltransferase involved in cell wall biosynthesis
MRILTLGSGEILKPGGANKFVVEINRELARLGHRCTVIVTGSNDYPRNEVYEGFRIIRVKSFSSTLLYGMNLNVCRYIKTHYAELDPDVVLIHGYHSLSSPLNVLLFRRFIAKKVPIAFTPHYDPFARATNLGKAFGWVFDRAIGKRILRIVDSVLADSDYEANNLSKILHVHAKLKTIPLGVDLLVESPIRSRSGKKRLLYLGYLLEYKGVQDIIRSLHELVFVRGVLDVELTIVGEGSFKEHLVREAENLKVSDFIKWKSFLSHSERLQEMNNADILVHLSRSEAYGLIVAEALAMGIPAIVTKGTALEEFSKEPGCYGVDLPTDPSKVADLILWIYQSRPKVGPFSRKIRLWNMVARDYEQTFVDLTNTI